MKANDIVTTLGGLVLLGASAAAALTIRILITSPTSVAGMTDGRDGLHAIANVLIAALSHLARYL